MLATITRRLSTSCYFEAEKNIECFVDVHIIRLDVNNHLRKCYNLYFLYSEIRLPERVVKLKNWKSIFPDISTWLRPEFFNNMPRT